jgi:hypothetical protein
MARRTSDPYVIRGSVNGRPLAVEIGMDFDPGYPCPPVVGRVYLNEQRVRVRVQRAYRVAGDVTLRSGRVLPKGTEVAIVSLVGRPKLTDTVAADSLRDVPR